MSQQVILCTLDPEGRPVPVVGTSVIRAENRLPVDPGQTGFFEGREARTFHEFSIPTGQQRTFRATVPIDIILFGLGVTLIQGQVRVSSWVSATESGTYDTLLPVLPRNTMSEVPQPAYVPQVVIETGTTADITGGTQLDVLLAKTADNANFSGAVGTAPSDERGIGANTYYIKIENTDGNTAIGVFSARWEERP